MSIQAEIVGYEETREIESIRDSAGEVIELRPIEGSERMNLKLSINGGPSFRVEVVPEDVALVGTQISQASEKLWPGVLADYVLPKEDAETARAPDE